MPAPTPSFDDIQKQITALLDDAKSKLMQAKNDERAVRLRISQLQGQLVHAQDALETAKNDLASNESVSSARLADLNRSVDEAQKTLDTLLADIEPAKRRLDIVLADLARTNSTVESLNEQKQTVESDIEKLKTKYDELFLTVQKELADAQAARDKKISEFEAVISEKSSDMQTLIVKFENIEIEHRRKVADLEDTENKLTAKVELLGKQWAELTDKNSELQSNINTLENNAQDILANVKRRENEITSREKAVSNKERAISTQMRRNLL